MLEQAVYARRHELHAKNQRRLQSSSVVKRLKINDDYSRRPSLSVQKSTTTIVVVRRQSVKSLLTKLFLYCLRVRKDLLLLKNKEPLTPEFKGKFNILVFVCVPQVCISLNSYCTLSWYCYKIVCWTIFVIYGFLVYVIISACMVN